MSTQEKVRQNWTCNWGNWGNISARENSGGLVVNKVFKINYYYKYYYPHSSSTQTPSSSLTRIETFPQFPQYRNAVICTRVEMFPQFPHFEISRPPMHWLASGSPSVRSVRRPGFIGRAPAVTARASTKKKTATKKTFVHLQSTLAEQLTCRCGTQILEGYDGGLLVRVDAHPLRPIAERAFRHGGYHTFSHRRAAGLQIRMTHELHDEPQDGETLHVEHRCEEWPW